MNGIARIVLATGSLFVAPATADPLNVSAEHVGPAHELNVNLFRNPSIGVEYRLGWLAAHVGMYPTIISMDDEGENETTWFAKAGLTAFFLGKSFYGQRESEFYATAAYMRRVSNGSGNGGMFDVGYRWMVWRGLNVRFGVAVLLEPDRETKVNPTPGIGWSATL